MTISLDGRTYSFVEQFDVNLAADYEIDRWDVWHMIREFVSNALDAVSNDSQKVTISSETGFVNIADHGKGYPIVFAKRIGASSKREDASSIGQFGEGTKMAILTALRKGLEIRLASQDWLIVPKLISEEEGLQILAYDIYQTNEPIIGSLVSVQAEECVTDVIASLSDLFLQFNEAAPLSGDYSQGIMPKGDQAKLYNKGVYIKDVDALFTYGLSLARLNRDRDLVDEPLLSEAIADIWARVDDGDLIRAYFKESENAGDLGMSSKLLEYKRMICPLPQVKPIWLSTFQALYGDKAVLYTDAMAAKEAGLLRYRPVRLEYYGRLVAELLGIKADTAVCRGDYAFTWAGCLTDKEQGRLVLFQKIADLVGFESPSAVRLYDSYAKSDWVLGLFDSSKDEVYLRRDHFGGDMLGALDTYLHELNHRKTGADDYERAFADGLSRMAGGLALRLAGEIGLSIKLKVTARGVQLPQSLRFSAESMVCKVATLGEQLLIEVAGRTLHACVSGVVLKPYATERAVTYYKGNFYANMPASIRELLPDELVFHIKDREILEQIGNHL